MQRLQIRRTGFRLEVGEPTQIAQRFRELAFDVAILATEPGITPAPVDGFSAEPLLDDPMLVLLPYRHSLLGRTLLPPAALTKEQWITASEETDPEYTLLVRIFTETGRKLRPVVQADDFAVTQAFVAAGLGLALLPQLAYDQIAKGVQARHVADSRFARRLHLAWRTDREGVEPLIDDIRETAATIIARHPVPTDQAD